MDAKDRDGMVLPFYSGTSEDVAKVYNRQHKVHLAGNKRKI